MIKRFLIVAALALTTSILAKPANDEISISINGASISPSDPDFYYYLQMAAAQAMAEMNKQDADEEEYSRSSKRGGKKRSRKENNQKEDAKFIRTMGALVSGIVQTAMTGNPGPAIMSTANAVATMVQ